MDRAAPSAARRPRDQALPLRPLTLGELLDAAAELVRRRAGVLPAAAAVLALAEQAVLVPGRDTVGVVLSAGLPELSSGYWQLLALGAGFEALIIVWLGLLTGRGVATALTSQVPRKGLRERLRGAEAVAVGGLIAAVPAALGAFLGPLWLLGYPLFGLVGVVVAVERRGAFGALGRAASVAFRGGMRVAAIRVLGYASWLLLRFAFYLGALAGLEFLPVGPELAEWLLVPVFVVANTLAYATLAALDAALLIESRIRLEGLDLWLDRASRRREPTPEMLAVR
ncbi:hypothetical protein [Catellatospora bangladeshensis]|uniref:Uncharacterized protein n=1 Tax=Catellatospora bangladeshensis TaxID=310355 RepID=A0A8J3JHI0_9ACTN|nr:hypothetical protein [Catellatospora bangladeshensis]GIF84711.1 hypothetical protein Cba03nite_60600 [Catellatospora bangladeshensis]